MEKRAMANHDLSTAPTLESATPELSPSEAVTEGSRDFDSEVGAFWRAWGDYQCPDWGTDEELDRRGDKVSEAYFAVCRMRAPMVRHVAEKLRILKTQMDASGEWADGRVELMLTSIYLDCDRDQFQTSGLTP